MIEVYALTRASNATKKHDHFLLLHLFPPSTSSNYMGDVSWVVFHVGSMSVVVLIVDE